jgi:micrococcal nuclease
LSLTNTPEKDQEGFSEAAQFTAKLCPEGSTITIDQDDLQPYDKYDRLVGKVFCGDKVLNSELLTNEYANILTEYCSTSEFLEETWVQTHGCSTKSYESKPKISEEKVETIPKENKCDPSYPDVCIPPYPPDLDCKEIPYKKFKVLPPDPHGFDGNKDGIGCQ